MGKSEDLIGFIKCARKWAYAIQQSDVPMSYTKWKDFIGRSMGQGND